MALYFFPYCSPIVFDTSALCSCDVEGLMPLFGHQPRNFY